MKVIKNIKKQLGVSSINLELKKRNELNFSRKWVMLLLKIT